MPDYDCYLLIHPERWPSNEPEVILCNAGPSEVDEFIDELGGEFDSRYGTMVREQAARGARKVAILDEFEIEALIEEAADRDLLDDDPGQVSLDELRVACERCNELQLTVGAPAAGFELVQAGALEVTQAARETLRDLPAGARVLVGGFARHDCVARVAAGLKRAGLDVTICELTTLPLRNQGAAQYVEFTFTSS